MEVTANRKVEKTDQTTCLQPPNELLKQQVYGLLDRAENEPDNVERWTIYQRIREMCRDLRSPADGHSILWPIVWATSCGILLIFVIAHSTRRTFYFSYPDNYLRIIKNRDPCLPDGSCGYRFVVQNVVNGEPQPETSVRFCSSLQPHFEAGHVLQWVRFTNLGSCLAIDGFDVVHGPDGHAVAAPNCTPDYSIATIAGHFNCEGGKAKFE